MQSNAIPICNAIPVCNIGVQCKFYYKQWWKTETHKHRTAHTTSLVKISKLPSDESPASWSLWVHSLVDYVALKTLSYISTILFLYAVSFSHNYENKTLWLLLWGLMSSLGWFERIYSNWKTMSEILWKKKQRCYGINIKTPNSRNQS